MKCVALEWGKFCSNWNGENKIRDCIKKIYEIKFLNTWNSHCSMIAVNFLMCMPIIC